MHARCMIALIQQRYFLTRYAYNADTRFHDAKIALPGPLLLHETIAGRLMHARHYLRRILPPRYPLAECLLFLRGDFSKKCH